MWMNIVPYCLKLRHIQVNESPADVYINLNRGTKIIDYRKIK